MVSCPLPEAITKPVDWPPISHHHRRQKRLECAQVPPGAVEKGFAFGERRGPMRRRRPQALLSRYERVVSTTRTRRPATSGGATNLSKASYLYLRCGR